MKGQTLSHYRVLELVGQGASGVIYKAEDLSLGRPVALKCLPPYAPGSGAAVLRFQHEARTASGINHPNICTIYEIAEHEGHQFIVMEWLEGSTLNQLIDRRPLKLDNLLDYAIQLADGLHAAHAEGVVHRDVKPTNIFVTKAGQVKILDFGIATLMRHSSHSLANAPRVGTAPYMSPEQVNSEDVDHRSDLFALGVVMYEMATARRPFVAGTIPDIVRMIADHSPDPPRALNSEVPEELDRIIIKALEKNRKMRFQTAADLKVDLQRLKRDFDSGVLRGTPQPAYLPARLPAHRGRRALVLLTVGGALAAGVLIGRQRKAPGADTDTEPRPAVRSTDILLNAPKAASATAQRQSSSIKESGSTIARPLQVDPPRSAASVSVADSPADQSLNRELDIVRTKADAGLYQQALQHLRPLLTRYSADPEIAAAHFLMGDIHEARGAHDEAMATYLEIADRFPGQEHGAPALYRFSDVAVRSKQKEWELRARQTLQRLATQYPESEWAPQGLLLKSAIEERHRLYEVDSALGTSVPSALVTYRRFVDAYPTSSGSAAAHQKLAGLYEDVKRYDLAARVFRDLATRYPDRSAEAWYRAAELYRRRLNDPASARDAYAKIPKGSRYFNDAQNRLR